MATDPVITLNGTTAQPANKPLVAKETRLHPSHVIFIAENSEKMRAGLLSRLWIFPWCRFYRIYSETCMQTAPCVYCVFM